ncbi:hypothetical protein [Arcicella rosea]|uniref:Uncharacterized protein n=1 Tax=Arcicella rosea TaxID=502909 RepID=A0A841EQT9_9BACT|nr:hypothetical protein [Arcicella rosea]MBB6001801.1 hypothetical protein [Arcicella rosea]
MTVFEESNLHFEFDDKYNIIKSDNNVNIVNAKRFLQGTKDTDFLGFYTPDKIFFMEVKNFRGVNYEDIDVLTNEVAQKLRDTIAIIAGASRNSTHNNVFWQTLHKKIGQNDIEIRYVFWLEEDVMLNNPQAKNRLQTINAKLKSKCKWLTTKVFVQSINNYQLDGINARFT